MESAEEMSRGDATHGRKFCPACFEAYSSEDETCPEDGNLLVRLQHHEGPLTGRMIDGKYIVVELLGRGGMGEVYRARQLPMNREVAIKVLYKQFLRNAQDVKRFVREASAASRMKSRYAAMIHDFGISQEGFIYLTMELAEGQLLSSHLSGRKPLDLDRTLHVAIDICHALEDAHANGIVHRDLKPGNVMLNVEDGHEIARVLDFGTARILDSFDDERVTDEGKVFGTPEYMCPEQAMGEEVDAWADLYSLGVMLYEMLTGQLPFTGKTHTAVLLSHINKTARPMAEVAPGIALPAALVILVTQLMAKKGQDRPASARIVRRELEEILLDLAGEPPESHKRRFRTRDTTASEVQRPQTLQLFGEDFYEDQSINQHFPTEELEPIVGPEASGPNFGAAVPPTNRAIPAPATAEPESGDTWDPPTGEVLEITSLPSSDDVPEEPTDPAQCTPWRGIAVGVMGALTLLVGALALAELL